MVDNFTQVEKRRFFLGAGALSASACWRWLQRIRPSLAPESYPTIGIAPALTQPQPPSQAVQIGAVETQIASGSRPVVLVLFQG